jgi:hypothetical protein
VRLLKCPDPYILLVQVESHAVAHLLIDRLFETLSPACTSIHVSICRTGKQSGWTLVVECEDELIIQNLRRNVEDLMEQTAGPP